MSIPPEIAEMLTKLATGFLGFLGAAASIDVFLRLRRSVHRWRYERALARKPEMSVEEEREYLWRIDEPIQPPSISRGRAGAVAAQLAPLGIGIAIWWIMLDLGYRPDGSLILFATGIAIGLAAWLFAFWKKRNDPPEDGQESDAQAAFLEWPTEAIHGATAAGCILLIFALFWWLAH